MFKVFSFLLACFVFFVTLNSKNNQIIDKEELVPEKMREEKKVLLSKIITPVKNKIPNYNSRKSHALPNREEINKSSTYFSVTPAVKTTSSKQDRTDTTKISYYDLLINQCSQKISFKTRETSTGMIVKKSLNCEDLFLQVKKDFSYNLTSLNAKKVYRAYFKHYYGKNKEINFNQVQSNMAIDLLNFDNFLGFSSFQEALLFYKKRDNNE